LPHALDDATLPEETGKVGAENEVGRTLVSSAAL
jgi:hypothetical protein